MKITIEYLQAASILPMLYIAIAWLSFGWRNPKANEMSFFRDFIGVIKFEKLPQYQ